MPRAIATTLLLVSVLSASMAAQTPRPFPKPGEPQRPGSPPPTTEQAVETPTVPSEATLGAPVYPGAEFLASYDAGRGQRYYLFGTNASYAEIVAYYRNVLRTRGDVVYTEPPVHMFDVGRFRAETMAFPPSVTVKDYTWGGSQGYLNPKRGAEPARFRTIIQVVPPPAGTAAR